MDFNYLGLVNRILSMGQQTTISSIETDNTSWGYKAQWAVNDAIQDLSTALKIKSRRIAYKFNTIAGTRLYALPNNMIWPPTSIKQENTPTVITQMSQEDYESLIPSDDSSDAPMRYYLEEYSPLTKPLDNIRSPETIIFTPATSESIQILLTGYEESSSILIPIYHSEYISISTGAVNSANSYSSITSISKPVSNGRINVSTTLRGDIGYLGAEERSFNYPIIGLYPIPSGAITIYVKGYGKMRPLLLAEEVPPGLPEYTVNAIVANAFARFMQNDPKTDSISRESLWKLYHKELAQLQAMDKQDGIQYQVKSANWAMPRKVYFRPLTRDGV